MWPIFQVFAKFLEKHSLRISSRSSEAALRHHMTHACKLTLDLVTAWPPLIVSEPREFREEWHDREFQYWEKSPAPSPTHHHHHHRKGSVTIPSAAPMKLFYTRPVLFGSYEGAVGAKGWVGNKEDTGAAAGCNSHTSNHRGRKTRS